MSPAIRYNPLRLLNSVPFGIALMVGIGLYIAGGSARPWFRDAGWDQIPGLGTWFDKTDMQFFDAWPLKTMIALLVANLVVVTWRRIPLTPPRYGVWCVHAGIITLVLGTATYYHLKVEGRVRIYADPRNGPNSVTQYYDKDERSLYLTVDTDLPQEIPLPELPRMKAYDDSLGNAADLRGRGLTGLEPKLQAGTDATKIGSGTNYGTEMGWGHPITLDVVGYWPYAKVNPDFVQQPTGGATGIQIDSESEGARGQFYVVGSDPDSGNQVQFRENFRHVELATPEAVKNYRKAAEGLFKISVSTTGPDGPPTDLVVQPGGTYAINGVVIKVLNYNPAFPMRETGKLVPMLALSVSEPNAAFGTTRPAGTDPEPATLSFQKMVLADDPSKKQTDFRLGPDGRPMGMGAKKSLDPNLIVTFHVSDPMALLPLPNSDPNNQEAAVSVKHTLITAPNQPGFTDIVTGLSQPAAIRDYPDAIGGDAILTPPTESQAPFAGASDEPADTAPPRSIHLHLKRLDHLVSADDVEVIPKLKRDTDLDESGRMQVVKVRVHFGSFTKDVLVPFSVEAYEGFSTNASPDVRWDGGLVMLPVPGREKPVRIQFQLGNHRRDLPATLTLNSFDAIPYPGIGTNFQDYKSDVTITTPTSSDGSGGDVLRDEARVNHPIYYDHGRWLFFQAAYDPNGKLWSELGVGNRPAINVMVTGCIMIFVGLMYAFYVKPIIIRKMKQNALAAAVARGKIPVARAVDRETTSV